MERRRMEHAPGMSPNPHATESGKLTPEQIRNWRMVLSRQLGPGAFFVSDEFVQKYRDRMQEIIDSDRSLNEGKAKDQ